jgi:hypothetical protein
LHELLKDMVEAKTEVKGEVNIVQGQEGWRTPDEAWMEDGREDEEEVHFVNVIQVVGLDSDEELAAEIDSTEEAVDNCYQRRARRARLDLWDLEIRPLSERRRMS